MIPNKYRKNISEIVILGMMAAVTLGISDIADPDVVIGSETRDLYDHLALLDQWSIAITEWSFPNGGSLIPPDIYSMILASPFLPFGRGIAADMALFCQIWLIGVSGWVLGKKLGSGLVGGICLQMSPYVLGQTLTGETETLNVWPLALLIASLLGKDETEWRWAGLWACLAAIGSWYYGAYAALVLGVWSLWKSQLWSTKRQWKPLQPIAIFIALTAVPGGIYAWALTQSDQLFRGPTMEEYLTMHPRALATFSGDPTSWLGTPRADSAHIDCLGWLIAIAAIFGLWAMIKQQDNRWKGIAILIFTGLILSLGPILHIKGVPSFDWMPYRLLSWIPPLDLMRLPHRWLVLAVIGLSALAAKGIQNLQWLWVLLIATDIFFFYLPDRQAVKIDTPDIIDMYRGPVIDLPVRTLSDDLRGKYLIWQRQHKQPIPYSILMQSWSKPFAEEPLIIATTANDRQSILTTRSVEAEQFRQADFVARINEWQNHPQWYQLQGAKERLKELGFSQICLHKNFLHPKDAMEIQRIIEAALGMPLMETKQDVLWTF